MTKFLTNLLRWLLLGILIYYIIAFPQQAADLTQTLVEGAIDLFVTLATRVAAFITGLFN